MGRILEASGRSCVAKYGEFGVLPLKMEVLNIEKRNKTNYSKTLYSVKLSQSVVDAYNNLLAAGNVFIPLPKKLTEVRSVPRSALNPNVTVNERDYGTDFDKRQAEEIHNILSKDSQLTLFEVRIISDTVHASLSQVTNRASFMIPSDDVDTQWADIKQWMLARAKSFFRDDDENAVLEDFRNKGADLVEKLLEVRRGTEKWIRFFEENP